MKVDELIEKLQKARSEVGNVRVDIIVAVSDWSFVTTREFDVCANKRIKGNAFISIEDTKLWDT